MTTDELTAGELVDGDVRVVSGSVLSGRTAMGPVHGYLGRYHRQVSALPEWRRRELLGGPAPASNRSSTIGSFLSRLLAGPALRDDDGPQRIAARHRADWTLRAGHAVRPAGRRSC